MLAMLGQYLVVKGPIHRARIDLLVFYMRYQCKLDNIYDKRKY